MADTTTSDLDHSQVRLRVLDSSVESAGLCCWSSTSCCLAGLAWAGWMADTMTSVIKKSARRGQGRLTSYVKSAGLWHLSSTFCYLAGLAWAGRMAGTMISLSWTSHRRSALSGWSSPALPAARLVPRLTVLSLTATAQMSCESLCFRSMLNEQERQFKFCAFC